MCNRIYFIIISLFFAFTQNIEAQYQNVIQLNYIQKYKDFAIHEMQQSAIPASVTLAQGLLESNAGQSWLAVEGNNHFGIKCWGNGDWYGETLSKEDDDRDENGNLISSCFRKYTSAEESYAAHSDFLRHPDKPWYKPLFELDITDYKAWAEGLQTAGYATNPDYPKLLISLIERYNLQQYDLEASLPLLVDRNQINTSTPTAISNQIQNSYINGLPYVLAKAGEKVGSIALHTGVSSHHLVKYNDDIQNPNQILKTGQIVFLKSKKWNNSLIQNKFHLVQKGETMVGISQMYGIGIFWLNYKNRMKEGMQPIIGSYIKLDGKRIKTRPVLATSQSVIRAQEEEFIVWEIAPPINPVWPVIHELPSRAAIPKTVIKEDKPANQIHIVIKGDTLWQISKKYGLTVDALKNMNNLSGNIISVGQELWVSGK